jgi:hypothetical protein
VQITVRVLHLAGHDLPWRWGELIASLEEQQCRQPARPKAKGGFVNKFGGENKFIVRYSSKAHNMIIVVINVIVNAGDLREIAHKS